MGSRLEKRIRSRVGVVDIVAGPQSARAEVHKTASDASAGLSLGVGGSKSARGPRENSLPGASGVVQGQGNAERMFSQSSMMEPKWSEIAKYSKLMEEKEKVDKRDKQRTAQETIRKHLDIQMAEKEQQKQALKEADTLLKQQQSA